MLVGAGVYLPHVRRSSGGRRALVERCGRRGRASIPNNGTCKHIHDPLQCGKDTAEGLINGKSVWKGEKGFRVIVTDTPW